MNKTKIEKYESPYGSNLAPETAIELVECQMDKIQTIRDILEDMYDVMEFPQEIKKIVVELDAAYYLMEQFVK